MCQERRNCPVAAFGLAARRPRSRTRRNSEVLRSPGVRISYMSRVGEIRVEGTTFGNQVHRSAQMSVGPIESGLGLVQSKALKKEKCELDAPTGSIQGANYLLAVPAG